MAFLQNLKIIPIINKIDAPGANIEEVTKSMVKEFNVESDKIHLISAKTGFGVDTLLKRIVEEIPPPKIILQTNKFKGFLVDSFFVKDLGVILVMTIRDGQLKKGDSIVSCHF